MNKKFEKVKHYLFLIPLLFVIVVKFPHLSVPYFWDEAWSYFPSVFKMYETGPGLLPGALSIWDAKGHPLFFFFITSSWMRLVGTSVFLVHVLPLLFSLGTLVAVYFLVKKQANLWAANIVVLLLSVQSLFLAQATMLLPEMLVTLLLVLSVNFYLRKKYWLFILFASLMVMTKETSIIFVGGFLLFHLFVYLGTGKEWRKYIWESFLLFIPIFVYGLFLILHKEKFGTFFFADHLDYIKLSEEDILRKLKVATGVIFTRYGRNIILLALLSALSIILFQKKKIKHSKFLGLLLLQVTIFLFFSVLNFYTHRYMLSLLVFFVISTGILIQQVKFKKEVINWLVVIAITAVPLYYTFTKKSNSDTDLGYVEIVRVHQQLVKYCEKRGWQNEPIAASFNLVLCLQNPHLGYVSTDERFTQVVNMSKFRQAQIFVTESTSFGYESQLDTIKQENKLIREFKLKYAWDKIYSNISEK